MSRKEDGESDEEEEYIIPEKEKPVLKMAGQFIHLFFKMNVVIQFKYFFEDCPASHNLYKL